jgi:hypothetical protein
LALGRTAAALCHRRGERNIVSGAAIDRRRSRVELQETDVITAIVRYKLPPSIDYNDCLAHFAKIAPGFAEAKGLISKHFIWNENGTAGGVYQWETLEAARAFYSGPWLKGIVDRYGMKPDIEYFNVFAITDNRAGTVTVLEKARTPASTA